MNDAHKHKLKKHRKHHKARDKETHVQKDNAHKQKPKKHKKPHQARNEETHGQEDKALVLPRLRLRAS
jgi:hypothetical protein